MAVQRLSTLVAIMAATLTVTGRQHSSAAEVARSVATSVDAETIANNKPDENRPARIAHSGRVAPDADENRETIRLAQANPFSRRVRALPFPQNAEWINTSGPLRLEDLRGRFVLLDFWTYCCINCMHILPELKKLEHAYPRQLVVVGVHSAKFDTEKERANIEEAVLRYEIEHPVVNDADHRLWNAYQIRSWPSMLLIDPEGFVVFGRSGEFKAEEIDAELKKSLAFYRRKGLLNESPIEFDRLSANAAPTPLRFPGKVLADEDENRLFIADSNHNRIVVTTLDGKLLDVIGSGEIGRQDGNYATASFNHPQGMALRDEVLFVADTENHLLRKIDLVNKRVVTIAGTGQQGQGWPGLERARRTGRRPRSWTGRPLATALNSPWAVWPHADQLYIAMAGPHQIWKMPLDGANIGPYAGNGREDIVDGPLLPAEPYAEGASSFAQPSGLTSDGQWLYVADSEGSSIRAVPLDSAGKVRTVVGTADLPHSRLFAFGDRDGDAKDALLQHVLGITYHQGLLYIADTYNNKIKAVDAATRSVRTIAGTGNPDEGDGAFDEPAGISYAAGKLFVADTNNHVIRTVDLSNDYRVATLDIAGLDASEAVKKKPKPSFPGAKRVKLKPQLVQIVKGKATLQIQLKLPTGWKINTAAPMGYLIEARGKVGPIPRKAIGEYVKPKSPKAVLNIPLDISNPGAEHLTVSLNYYYCQEGDAGICKTGSVIWEAPLKFDPAAKEKTAKLPFAVVEKASQDAGK